LTESLFEVVPIEALSFPAFKSRVDPLEFLDELALSISQIGVLEPILVRPRDNLYEVVAGERRARAAKKAGLFEVPVVVRHMSDQEAMEAQLVENLQRKDLSDYEKARWLLEMIKRFGYTQKQLAEKIGKDEPWVSRHLNLLKLEENLSRDNLSELTEKQARVLLSAPPEKRARIAAQIEETGDVPSARELERLINPSEGAIQAALGITVPRGTPESPPDADTIVQDISPEAPAEPKPAPKELVQAEFTCKTCGERFLIVHMHPSGNHALKPIREKVTES